MCLNQNEENPSVWLGFPECSTQQAEGIELGTEYSIATCEGVEL